MFDLQFDGQVGESGNEFERLPDGKHLMIPAYFGVVENNSGPIGVKLDFVCVGEKHWGSTLRFQALFFHKEKVKEYTAQKLAAIRAHKFAPKTPTDFAKNLFGYPVWVTVKTVPHYKDDDKTEQKADRFTPAAKADIEAYLTLLRDKENLNKLKDQVVYLHENNNKFAAKYDNYQSDFHAAYFGKNDSEMIPDVNGSFTREEYLQVPTWVRPLIPSKSFVVAGTAGAEFTDDIDDDFDDEEIPF